MSKETFKPLSGPGHDDAGRATAVGTSTRVYLTPKAKKEALAALAQEQKKHKADAQDPASPDLLAVARRSNGTWDALRKCIDRSWRAGSKTWSQANRLAGKLLHKAVRYITTTKCPDEQPGTGDGQMQISYPTTIADYRAVIVGQLPSADLHPVVIVQPDDREGFWYPQHAGKHNPIQVGSAFSCLAHFGNPHAIGHLVPGTEAQDFEVRVYALRDPWEGGSDRFKDRDLPKMLEPLSPEYMACFTIQRELPVAKSVTVKDSSGAKSLVESTKVIKCSAPLTIEWKGKEANIEVREGRGDRVRCKTYASSPVTIDIDSRRESKDSKHLTVRKPGLYRVRLHPHKFSFIDPAFELWLEIDAMTARRDQGLQTSLQEAGKSELFVSLPAASTESARTESE